MNDNMPRSGDGADVRDTVRNAAADLAHGAKEQAREQYDRQKNVATGELGSLATALRRAGNELGDEHATSSKVITTVADRIDSFGRSLEGKDLDRVVRDVETFARRNPAAFLGGAVAVGFLASRFLKSGSSRSSGEGSDFYSHESYSGYSRGTSESPLDRPGYGSVASGYGIERASDAGLSTARGGAAPSGSSGTANTTGVGSGTGVSGTIGGTAGSLDSPGIDTATDRGTPPGKGRR